MKSEPLYSLKEAASLLGGYPQLLRNLIARHDVPHRLVAGRVVLENEGIRILRPLVHDWNTRPRLSKPMAASA